MATQPTKVVFRKWRGKDGGDVIALFPELAHDPAGRGYLCESYQHLGEHGGADYTLCIRSTVAATPEEYGPLLRELTQRGYTDLVVMKRHKRGKIK